MRADEARKLVSERGVDPARLHAALGDLAPNDETGAWLAVIANNDGYPEYQRFACAARIFECCVHPGTDLEQAGRLLAPASWLRDEMVEVVATVAGELLVGWDPADTVYVLRRRIERVVVPPVVYLRLTGRVAADAVLKTMRGAGPLSAPIIVREIAVAWH